MTVARAGGLREAQRMALSLSWHQREVWKCPERTLTLKSRQLGISTLESLKLYYDSKFHGRSGAVIAHDVKSAEYLFEKFERAWANDMLGQPKLKISNVRQMRFSNQQGRVEVCTSQSPDALRSRTLQSIHGSEVALWGDEGPKLHKAIMKFVGQRLDTCVNHETTAQGEDPLFHPMWANSDKHCKLKFIGDTTAPYGFRIDRELIDKDKWNGFHPLFISVLVDEKARIRLEPGEENRLLKTLDEEEDWIIATQNATFEFLKWRRWAIVQLCNGDINDFHQDYPITAEQAFVATGRPRFNYDPLNRMHIEPGVRGFLRKKSKWSGDLSFVEEARGEMILFRPNEPGHRYVLAIDPSEGIPSENPNCPHCSGDSDEASVQVYDIDSPKLEQVALYYGPYNEEQLVTPALNLAEYYNMAYVVIERVGGHGDHLSFQFGTQYPPERVFSMEGKRDSGLKVHTGNRMGLNDDLASAIDDELLEIHSERTVHQLKMVKRIQMKKIGYEGSGARAGHHDDDASSLWGIIQGWRFYPRGLDPIEKHQHLVRRRAGKLQQIGDGVMEEERTADPYSYY
jgi:hypothetical protein